MANLTPLDDNHKNGSSSNGHYRGEYIGDNLAEQKVGQNDSEVIDLKQIFGLLWHNKWWIILFTLLGTTLSAIYAYNQVPIYQSNGTLLITTAGNRYSMAGSDLDALLVSNFGVGMGSSLQNEILVLRSRTFSKEIADRIFQERYMSDGTLFPILWREYPYDSTLVRIETIQSRISRNISFAPMGRDNNGIIITFDSPSPEEATRIVDLAIVSYSDVSTRLNRQQARNALDFLEMELSKVASNLDAAEFRLRSFMEQTKLVEINQQTMVTINQFSSISAQRQQLSVQLVGIESSIASFTEELEKLRPGLAEQITSSISQRLNRLQYALAELETQRTLLFARNPELANLPEERQVSNLNQQIRALRSEINQISLEVLNDENSFVGAVGVTDGGIISQINSYRSNLIRLSIEQRQIQVQTEVYDQQLKKLQVLMDSLPDHMIELARAKRDLQMNEQLFVAMSRQYQEMQLWEQTQSGVARVVDMAERPFTPIKPRIPFFLAIGFIMGGFLSVAFIFAREFFTVELNSVDKLHRKGYPLLTVIPDMRNHIKENFAGKDEVFIKGYGISTGLTMLLDSISPISESYRRLQSNVIYSQPDNTFKTLLITSSNKSEGKTTLSSNFAVALAEAGKKVLLIDCDFRRPRVHVMFGLDNTSGIMNVLFDGKSVNSVIQQSLIPNVDVLTTGKRPPNPAEIIRSLKLRQLIKSLESEYDHVIIDSAPFGIISDAAPLIKEADGVILVTRFNQTKEPELDLTIENLKKVKANVVGTVMTAFDHKKSNLLDLYPEERCIVL